MATSTVTIPVQHARQRTLSLQEQGYRQFEITSAQEVETPGLLEIEELVFGWNKNGHHSETMIPPYTEHKVPLDTTESRFQDVRYQNYALAENQDGVPVVIRGSSSNDGNWQVGGFLLIKGKWAEVKKAPTPATETKPDESKDKK
jgi:hypothetical protein